MNTRRKLGIFQADTRGVTQELGRGGQAVARGSCLSELFDRGAEAASRGAVPCASQVLGRRSQAVVRGGPRSASHVLGRGVQAGAHAAACGDATLSQQMKNTRQMSRNTE